MTMTLVYRNITLFLFLETVDTSVSMRKREKRGDDDRCRHRLVEDCYIDLFFILVVFPYSRPNMSAFLTGSTQQEATVGHYPPVTCRSYAGPDCQRLIVYERLRDWPFWCGYPWIYNFITPCILLFVNLFFRLSNRASFVFLFFCFVFFWNHCLKKSD